MASFPIDSNFKHLLPSFATRLKELLARMEEKTNTPWMMNEGYRSGARQAWLFGSGRPYLGGGPPWYGRPGSVVTKKRVPSFHGAGVAADCYAKTKTLGFWRNIPSFNEPPEWWRIYQEEQEKLGMRNPARAFGDMGHVQSADPAEVARGRAFVAAGFQAPPPPVPVPAEVPLLLVLDGVPRPDVGCSLLSSIGRVQLAARTLATHLDWTILDFTTTSTGGSITVLWDDGDPFTPPAKTTKRMPVRLVGEIGYLLFMTIAEDFPMFSGTLDTLHHQFLLTTGAS